MNYIKNKLSKWLGIKKNADDIAALNSFYEDLVSIGVDVHIKSPSMILIYSHLKGGQIRHIDADFNDLRELNSFVRELKGRFKTETVTYDLPSCIERGWMA